MSKFAGGFGRNAKRNLPVHQSKLWETPMCFPDPPIRCVVRQSTHSEPSKVWVQQGRPQKSCWARQHDHATHRASCAHHASVRPSLAPSPRSFLTAAATPGWETTPTSLALQGARFPHGPWSAASPRHRLASSRSAGGVRANVGRSVTASQLCHRCNRNNVKP